MPTPVSKSASLSDIAQAYRRELLEPEIGSRAEVGEQQRNGCAPAQLTGPCLLVARRVQDAFHGIAVESSLPEDVAKEAERRLFLELAQAAGSDSVRDRGRQ